MGNWADMGRAWSKRWWALMSCALFTAIAAVANHFSFQMKSVEHLLEISAVVLVFIASSFEWIDEHKRLLEEVQGRKADLSRHEASMDLLRTQRDDYASRLSLSDVERVTRADSNRPEVFANYSNTIVFEEVEGDTWNPEVHAFCMEAIQVDNRGGSPAFQVTIPSVFTPHFRIDFSTIQRVDVGMPAYSDATLYPRGLQLADTSILANSLIQEDGSYLFYEAKHSPLQVKIDPGLSLKVTWRNSSNNFFFSTTKNGQESPVQRMDAPITEAEMKEAYEGEDYG